MKEFQRLIKDVAGCLRRAHGRDAKCSVLVGAGCSKSAGVPLAGEIINIIQKDYPDAFERAVQDAKGQEPSYSQCMNQLSPAEVHHLIGYYVDIAKLNWAHLGLAQLVKAGFVDRVLTTNFDPLVVRACNLVGVSPSVYDFAASPDFEEDMVDGPAVYYLHGQRTGFRLLNVLDDLQKHTETLNPIIKDSCSNRVWIVVGYSGANDAVFECLSQIRSFRHNLYWVIREDEPPKHLQPLFQSRKNAYHIKSSGADEFFVALANELGCFPPKFITEPFAHFLDMLEPVMDFTAPGSHTPNQSILEYPRGLLNEAIENQRQKEAPTPVDTTPPTATPDEVKPKPKPDAGKVLRAYMQGDYDQVLQLTDPAVVENNAQSRGFRADALNNVGVDLCQRGEIASSSAAIKLFEQASDKYQQVLTIKPNDHDALNNWGGALANQAKHQQGQIADSLWAQAIGKYQQALAIKPDKHETLNNWGETLDQQARRKDGAAADALWQQASEKYQQALDIKPDKHETLSNWGAMLLMQATRKSGVERQTLLAQAEEKFRRAGEMQPGSATYNRACVASLREKIDEARRWLEKCASLGELPPRKHMEKDEDLDSLRELPWFEEILQKAPQ